MIKETIKQIFPNSIVVDAALVFPITKDGWEVQCPGPSECRFHEPDFYLVLNLQDMLSMNEDELFPIELGRIHATYEGWADLNRIIVIVWPSGLAHDWNKGKSFKVVEFSDHQYHTWQSYKESEVALRKAFKHKNLEDNFLCMNRIDKEHRRAVYEVLKDKPGNSSYQQMGKELKYKGFSYLEYDKHYDNLSNLFTLKKNFNTSLFSIVTESQYFERYGIVSEKTMNAIVAGHPFIVIGHQHILEDIRAYGFKTYDHIFDEGYDTADNKHRAGKALDDNHMFIDNMSENQMYDILEYCQETIDYNRDYFFKDFGKRLKDGFQKQLLNLWKQGQYNVSIAI